MLSSREWIMAKPLLQVDPSDLLDWARWKLQIFSDFDLAHKLETSASAISKIRRGHSPLGSTLLLRLLVLTDARFHDLPLLIEHTRPLWRY
jgi:hypothetical protein